VALWLFLANVVMGLGVEDLIGGCGDDVAVSSNDGGAAAMAPAAASLGFR
jgi:hypothetical protein